MQYVNILIFYRILYRCKACIYNWVNFKIHWEYNFFQGACGSFSYYFLLLCITVKSFQHIKICYWTMHFWLVSWLHNTVTATSWWIIYKCFKNIFNLSSRSLIFFINKLLMPALLCLFAIHIRCFKCKFGVIVNKNRPINLLYIYNNKQHIQQKIVPNYM